MFNPSGPMGSTTTSSSIPPPLMPPPSQMVPPSSMAPPSAMAPPSSIPSSSVPSIPMMQPMGGYESKSVSPLMSGASGGESKPLQDNNSKQTGNTLMNQSQTSEKKSGFFQKIAASVLPRSLTGEVYLPDNKDKSVPDPVFRDCVIMKRDKAMGEDKSIITKAGNKVALEIPVAGEPAPTSSWSIGDIKLEPEKEKLAPEYNRDG